MWKFYLDFYVEVLPGFLCGSSTWILLLAFFIPFSVKKKVSFLWQFSVHDTNFYRHANTYYLQWYQSNWSLIVRFLFSFVSNSITIQFVVKDRKINSLRICVIRVTIIQDIWYIDNVYQYQ